MVSDVVICHSVLDSGHGGQTKDLDGDEQDGLDETLVPVDRKTAGAIVDEWVASFYVASEG